METVSIFALMLLAPDRGEEVTHIACNPLS
jgi:hypothetical protein